MDAAALLSWSLLAIMVVGNGGITYNICKTGWQYGRPSCENIYLWNNIVNDYVSLSNVTLSINRTYSLDDLRGKTVRVIADNMLPYITSSNLSQQLGGFLGDIWQLIEKSLGFKSDVTSIHYDTGLEIITSGGADVMLAAVVEKKGLSNVQYSQPYFYNWYHLVVKAPEAKASSSSYLKTFDAELWFVTLIIFAVLTMSVWITIKFLNSVYRIEPSISLPSCFLGVTSGFINQGFDLKLSSYSARMQLMFALVLGVVLFSAMNAVLVAQLAVFDIPFPFTSLDDIANKRTHSLCLRSNSFVYNNFTDENKIINPRWRGILNGVNCLDINNQTNLATIMCNNKLVILENRIVMETILKNYEIPCEIKSHHEKFFLKGNSFLMLKAFEHKKIINRMVKKMKSTGILQRLEYQWVRREKLVNINNPKSPQVTLDHVEGILILYAVMMLLSLLMLLAEIMINRHSQRDLLISNESFHT